MKRFSALLAVVAIVGISSSASAALVAYWDFEEGSGLTTRDQINGNDDPLTGTTWVTNALDLPPVPSGTTAAMLFTRASSTYIDTAFDGVGGTGARTIAFWLKLTDVTDTAASQGLVTYGGREANGRKWHVRINSGGLPRIRGAVRTEAQGGNQTGTTNLADGQWHHVASVFPGGPGSNNTDVIHFVDGILEGETGTTDEPINTSIGGNFPKVILGARRQSGNATPTSAPADFLNGMMDDVRFYDHALTQSEIGALALFVFPGGPGDANFDGTVDILDYMIIRDHFLQVVQIGMDGDLNFSGVVEFADFGIWKNDFAAGGPAGVPEPGTGVLLLIGALAPFVVRRRARRIWL